MFQLDSYRRYHSTPQIYNVELTVGGSRWLVINLSGHKNTASIQRMIELLVQYELRRDTVWNPVQPHEQAVRGVRRSVTSGTVGSHAE